MINNTISDYIDFISPYVSTYFRQRADLLNTTLSTLVNETYNSATTDANDKEFLPHSIGLLAVVTFVLISLAAFGVWKKRRNKIYSRFNARNMFIPPHSLSLSLSLSHANNTLLETQ